MVLGSAAGGGVPQWNCACAGCAAARAGRIPCRTQSSLALSADGVSWFLINASPDLRSQFFAAAAFQPQGRPGGRSTPLEGVLLTNADLDHTLGVVLLREADEPLPVHAPAAARLRLGWLDDLLAKFCGISWHETAPAIAPLLLRDGGPSGLGCRSFDVSAGHGEKDSAAYVITDERTGSRLLAAPDVASLTEELRDELQHATIVFWDGTFWTDDELSNVVPGRRRAHAMGHLPLGEGGLQALAASPAPVKVLIHLNNTNPVLLPGSPQRAEVEAHGILVAADGMAFEI